MTYLEAIISQKGNLMAYIIGPFLSTKTKKECLYKHHMTFQKGNFDGLVSIFGE